MKTMKSKLLLAIACITTALTPHIANAAATRITSYNALLDALKNGHRVMAVGDVSKCTILEYDNKGFPKDDLPDPDLEAIIGINFTSNFFIKYRDNGDKRFHVLANSNNMGGMADGTPLHRYKQIKIYDDNTARIYVAAGDYQTGKLKGHVLSSCTISSGHDQNGLSIFDYDVTM